MFAATLSAFWPLSARAAEAPRKATRRSAPVFFGDAVQPFGEATLLLALLRSQAEEDQS